MAIKWTEALAVGVSEIDSQHQELFKRVNQLLESCNQGKGKAAVAEMMVYLESYVAEHFALEERLQKASGYPHYQEHKAMHQAFLQNVTALKQQLELGGPTLPFVIAVNKTVVDWLTSHISKVDKALAQYIKK